MAEADRFKKASAKWKKISDTGSSDTRIRIFGKVIDKADGIIIVDDGTGKADIVADNDLIKSLNVNDTVCVFVMPMPIESGFGFQADAIQNMNGIDISLFRRVFGW